MKKYFFYFVILCTVILAGCEKDNRCKNGDCVVVMGDKVIINNWVIINKKPNVIIDSEMNVFPATSVGRSSFDMVRTSDNDARTDLHANDYRFKLVAQEKSMNIDADVDGSGTRTYKVQASHVKIIGDGNTGYAFVAYNHKYEPNIGGLVIYQYTVVNENSLEAVSAILTPVTSIEMPNAQINALDYADNKLYIAGASQKQDFFQTYQKHESPAFLMILNLLPDKNVVEEKPVIKQLTSYQATSISKFENRIYVTTGDGTNNSR
jgi:hypothetical protein